jgi:hypothetical protein
MKIQPITQTNYCNSQPPRKNIAFGDLYVNFNKAFIDEIPRLAEKSGFYKCDVEKIEWNCSSFWQALKIRKKQLKNSPVKALVDLDHDNSLFTLTLGLEDKHIIRRNHLGLPSPSNVTLHEASFQLDTDGESLMNFNNKFNSATDLLNNVFKEQNKLISLYEKGKVDSSELFEKLNVKIDEEWLENEAWDRLSPSIKEMVYNNPRKFLLNE